MLCNRLEEECFFFDIDVKGGEKSLRGEESLNACGCESRVRMHVGASRVQMHVGACVAINAKGGDCWKIFNRQRTTNI
jgi:hypothetical protein